jgi:hypothetical protein
MIALLFAFGTSQASPPAQALALCKTALQREANGEIATMDVGQSRSDHGRLTIEGRITAYARMGPAPAGTARAHHIGRFELSYRCEITHGRVRKVRLNPAEP